MRAYANVCEIICMRDYMRACAINVMCVRAKLCAYVRACKIMCVRDYVCA